MTTSAPSPTPTEAVRRLGELLGKVSPAPWNAEDAFGNWRVNHGDASHLDGWVVCEKVPTDDPEAGPPDPSWPAQNEANLTFIAAARNLLPVLLAHHAALLAVAEAAELIRQDLLERAGFWRATEYAKDQACAQVVDCSDGRWQRFCDALRRAGLGET